MRSCGPTALPPNHSRTTFMYHNDITMNIFNGTAIMNEGFNLLHPIAVIQTPTTPPLKLHDVIASNITNRKLLLDELHIVCAKLKLSIDESCETVKLPDVIAAVQT